MSPNGRTAGNNTWIEVVPTTDLRTWLSTEKAPRVGRMLQHLGQRRSPRDPDRGWKVVVFDVDRSQLCRPVRGTVAGDELSEVVTCPDRFNRATSTYNGCGLLTDLATGENSLPVFRIQWRDAIREGFCVLPAERFVRGG